MASFNQQQIVDLAALLAGSCEEFCDRTITPEMADEMIKRLLARTRIIDELVEHETAPD